eukprot:jgi/Bigna1/74546/fgenesh1_pg.29_\
MSQRKRDSGLGPASKPCRTRKCELPLTRKASVLPAGCNGTTGGGLPTIAERGVNFSTCNFHNGTLQSSRKKKLRSSSKQMEESRRHGTSPVAWLVLIALACVLSTFLALSSPGSPQILSRGSGIRGRQTGYASSSGLRMFSGLRNIRPPSPQLGGASGNGGDGGRRTAGKADLSLQDDDRDSGDDDANKNKGNDLSLRLSKFLKDNGLDENSIPADLIKAFLSGRIGLGGAKFKKNGERGTGMDALQNWLVAQRSPIMRRFMETSTMIRDRLIMNPAFMRTLGIEIGVGLGATLVAQLQQRGDKFKEQLDFVCADLSIVIAANIALVTALSPAAPIAAPATAGIGAALAKLPAFVAQSGSYTPAQRFACGMLKGAQFAVLGTAASAVDKNMFMFLYLVGQGMAKGLITLREKLNPEHCSAVELAPIVPTALNFGAYMFVSSNPRYQIVNGLEQSLLPRIPGELAQTAASTATRVYNNYLGGVTWIWWARWMGLQSSD